MIGVALLSGGLDSGTSLALWCESSGTAPLCLFIDYGQRAAAPEATASERLARRFGAPWRSVELPWLADAGRIAGAAIVTGATTPIPERTERAPGDAASAAAVWVPARNFVLIAVAAAWADALGAEQIVVGFNREEAATFPDNSVDFATRTTAALELGTRVRARITAPTAGLDKPAIVVEARRLGLQRSDFWSCYHAAADPATCPCESCVRSRLAWG